MKKRTDHDTPALAASCTVILCAVTVCLAALIATSCSVKENRAGCPVYLLFDGIGNPHARKGEAVVSVYGNDDSMVTRETPDMELLTGGGYILTVPKGHTSVNAVTGITGMSFEGDTLLVAEKGTECDSLYSFTTSYDTVLETWHLTGDLFKQFATLTMTVKTATEDYPYGLVVTGNVCGINLLTFSPAAGEFECVPGREDADRWALRIPRQKDSSLTLQLWDGDTLVDELPLGQYIASLGYDWTAPDLADIDVLIDYARASVRITVADWDLGQEFGIVEI